MRRRLGHVPSEEDPILGIAQGEQDDGRVSGDFANMYASAAAAAAAASPVVLAAPASAVVSSEGTEIVITWSDTDPGGWTTFSKDGALSASGATGSHSGANAISSYEDPTASSGGGTLTLELIINLQPGAPFSVNEPTAEIDLPAALVTDDTGMIETPASVNLALDVEGIGRLAPSGSGSLLQLWCDAHALEAFGTAAGAIDAWRNRAQFPTVANSPAGTAAQRPSLVHESGSTPAYVDFDGSTDRLGIADFFAPTNDMAFLAVCQPDDHATAHTLVAQGNSSGGTQLSWALGIEITTGAFAFKTSADGAAWGTELTFGTASTSEPTMVYLERSGTTVEAAVNGDWVFSGSLASATVFNSTAQVVLGSEGTTVTKGLNGRLLEAAVWTTKPTETQAAQSMYEAAKRAGIVLGRLTTPAQPFALPVGIYGVINCFGAHYSRSNPFGQAPGWFDDGAADLEAFLQDRFDTIRASHADFRIVIRLPHGRLAYDTMSSYPGPAMTSRQWDALRAFMAANNLGDGTGGTEELWIYTGFGYPINPTTGALETTLGRMHNRTVPFSRVANYASLILAEWDAQDTAANKLRLIMADAASQAPRKFCELVHDAAILAAGWKLIGEAIPTESEHRLRAPWHCLVSFASAPWWTGGTRTYDPAWTVPAGAWFGAMVQNGDYADLTGLSVSGANANNLTQANCEEFLGKGCALVAFPGTYTRVGAAFSAVFP